MTTTGKFYGIGVGPGDPELLTLKAARILAEVDCVFLPATAAHENGFAGRIVASLRLNAAKFRPVTLCMCRQRDIDQGAYERAADDILTELRRGRSAAWIAEGDPLFYSTFVHVWEALRRLEPALNVEIVPGITSIQAGAALAGMPMAMLDEQVAIMPAAYGLDRLADLVRDFAVVCLLKVHRVFDQLLDRLAALPRPVEAVYIEKVGTADERLIRDLPALRGQTLPYFSLVLLRGAAYDSHRVEVAFPRLESCTTAIGRVVVVGVGPGHADLLTPQAALALRQADVVVGYSGYFPWVEELLRGKECIALPLGQERERASIAIERAVQGHRVAVISSGDPGIYAMASVVLEMLATVEPNRRPEVEVVPGVSALNAAAALLGAPLGHDFAAISLSDLLTPWEVIEKRLRAAAAADFVLALFNPKSQRRDWQLARAREILLSERRGARPSASSTTPAGPGKPSV